MNASGNRLTKFYVLVGSNETFCEFNNMKGEQMIHVPFKCTVSPYIGYFWVAPQVKKKNANILGKTFGVKASLASVNLVAPQVYFSSEGNIYMLIVIRTLLLGNL